MKKIIAILVLFILMLSSTFAMSNIGQGYFNAQGITKFTDDTSKPFAIYDLKSSYNLGETISVGAYQRYTGGCNGQVKMVIEIYNAPVGQQTTSTYIGGDSETISSPVSGTAYYRTMQFLIPSTGKAGQYSISSYLLCTNPVSVVSKDSDGSIADEKNFNVVAPNTAPTCTKNSFISCYGGNLYYYDSCGVKGNLYQNCVTGTLCSSGKCQTPSCEKNAYSKCYENNVYYYDSCNVRGDLKTNCQYGCSSSGSCNEQIIKTTGIKLIGLPVTTNTKFASGEKIQVTQEVEVTGAAGSYMLEAGLDKYGSFSILVSENTCNPEDVNYKNNYVQLPVGKSQITFTDLEPNDGDGNYKLHTAIVDGCGGKVIEQANQEGTIQFGEPSKWAFMTTTFLVIASIVAALVIFLIWYLIK